MAPSRLASGLQSLPPILDIPHQNSILGCSKGSWGLSVQQRVMGILTHATSSSCISLRQCPSRYAFRAGRNLPDKEFRYLRTVIVTAAVYWGFNSELLPPCGEMTPPFNLPAPGRRQTLYIDSLSLQSPVFLLNSRLGQLSATSSGSK